MNTSYGDMNVNIPKDREGDFGLKLMKQYQNTVSQDMEGKSSPCMSKEERNRVYEFFSVNKDNSLKLCGQQMK